ncbi:uncharacterized protein LOC127988262 isoform X2 [Carassius gibelio]|uniref:uncharacterized protein LOC127988262 isoform X2 n=1 Tax=Carassius gibelio TaxID=101364 RepID=UPI0022795F1A|nr:uncharacterized protein LOC127988262 isoform X2 [Carassius gibelio]
MLKILKLHLYLLIWCQAAETLTDQLTDLGQNVTINCDLNAKVATWFLLNLPNPPVVLLDSLLNPPSVFYYKNNFSFKYSVQSKHRLFINNITFNELGVYYCINTETEVKFSNGIRLQTISIHTDPTTPAVTELPQCQNHTEVLLNEQTTWMNLLALIFCMISVLLVIGMIAFLRLLKVSSDGRYQKPQRHMDQE